jgi:hypothetical protein
MGAALTYARRAMLCSHGSALPVKMISMRQTSRALRQRRRKKFTINGNAANDPRSALIGTVSSRESSMLCSPLRMRLESASGPIRLSGVD